MTEIRYNKNDKSHTFINLEPLIQGSKESYELKLSIGTYVGSDFTIDTSYRDNPDLTVGGIYTRPDGKKSWYIPFIKNADGTFQSVLSGWLLRESGNLLFDMQVKNTISNVVTPFTRASLVVEVGTSLDGEDWHFTEADYDSIISNISLLGGRVLDLEFRVDELEETTIKEDELDEKTKNLIENTNSDTYLEILSLIHEEAFSNISDTTTVELVDDNGTLKAHVVVDDDTENLLRVSDGLIVQKGDVENFVADEIKEDSSTLNNAVLEVIGGTVVLDEESITRNNENKIQAVGVQATAQFVNANEILEALTITWNID